VAVPVINGNFSGGELAPDLWGHTELGKFKTSVATARNLFCNYRGGLYSRAGTAVVGRMKQPYGVPPRDIPFQFSLNQSYALEFGDTYMRVKSNGAYVTESTFNITAASQTVACQLTVPGHNFVVGDWIFIQFVQGMIQLNGNTYIVRTAAPGIVTLNDLDGNAVNATGFSAYTSGGVVARLFTLVTPYLAVDLPYLKFTQSADVVSLTLVNLETQAEYPPYELKRLGPTNWTLSPLALGATLPAPGTVTAAASDHPNPALTPPTKPCAYAYEVTAVDLVTGDESNPSARVDVVDTVDMGVTAGSVTVSWSPVAGAGQYNIYRTAPAYNTKPSDTAHALPVPAGAFFFLAGSAYGNQFVDTNIVTDAGKTPPLHLNPFARGQVPSVTMLASSADWTTATVSIASGTGSGWQGEAVIVGGSIAAIIVTNPGQNYTNADSLVFAGGGTSASGHLNVGPQSGTYPAVAAYFQQRRLYAQTLNQPDTLFGSQSGLFTNFDAGNPPIDTDAIIATPFSQAVNGIQWLVPMPGGLVALTGTSAWQLTGAGGSGLNPVPLTPSSEQAQSQAYNGISGTVPPIRINYNILYVGSLGSFPYELNYNLYFNIYYANDIGWPSDHLFTGHQIKQWAWCETPWKIIWAVREDGALLSLTYVKEQEVQGWTRHDTQGLFQGVCAVTEPAPKNKATGSHALYLIAARFVQNRWLYFAERMDDRQWRTVEECWCVDSGLSTLKAASFPTATLTADAGFGANDNFGASANVFQPSHVGAIIRMGGGIVTITQYLSPSQVRGTWTRPLVNKVPNDPNGLPRPALAGEWSLLFQVNNVGGLAHLAGKTVVGLADGVPIGPLTVAADGTVALPFLASLVTLGLQFTPQFQSLYLEVGSPTVQGRRKNLPGSNIRLEHSGYPRILANQPDGSALDPPQLAPLWAAGSLAVPSPAGTDVQVSPTYQTAAGQTVTPLATGDVYAPLGGDWRKTGQVAAQQLLPLPLNITSIEPVFLEGDVPENALSQRQPPKDDRRRSRVPA
jgi:hypothetical protein